MKTAFAEFRQNPMFRQVMIVPTAIMLIFSLFTLTAAPDPARMAAAFNLGVVNEDTGMVFPPIKLSTRIMDGLSGNLPFAVTQFETPDAARAALEAGEVSSVLLFAPDFSKAAFGEETVEIDIWNAQHLTISESQVGAQLPTMIQLGMSAAVASVRLALAKGQMPSGAMPVNATVETFHKVENSAFMVSPFVMVFTTWLAAFVGAMLMFQASKSISKGAGKAAIRTFLPIAATGIATFVLSLVVSATTGDWSLLIPVWLAVWAAVVCVTWLMAGLFSVLGMASLLIILPTVFYQSALGGAQAPLKAAPEWLQSIGAALPFDELGAGYRSVVLGGGAGMPYANLLIVAVIGLALIWGGSMLIGPKQAD